MKIKRKTEDYLREEYFSLYPQIKSATEILEIEINHALLNKIKKLKSHEKIIVTSRVKECESAIRSLKRRQEASTFDPSKKYSLTKLKDLVGIRISVFPSNLASKIDLILKRQFKDWHSDPLKLAPNLIFPKYHSKILKNIHAEYQVVPLLIDLFWKVEHSTLYKPNPSLIGAANSLKMQALQSNVYQALQEFDLGFKEFI